MTVSAIRKWNWDKKNQEKIKQKYIESKQKR